jgi:dCTP diphosphatase
MSEDDRFASVQARLRQFVEDREWQQFHDPKNLAMLVASEAGELAAELRWVRNDESDAFVHDTDRRLRLANEIADVAIAVLLFCQRTELDLIDVIERKLELNAHAYPIAESKGRADRP